MCPPRTAAIKVVCPTPRRLNRLPLPHAADVDAELEPCGLRAAADLLDIVLPEGGVSDHRDSSPPFFCGSPPSRPCNPVVDDPLFGQEPFMVSQSLSDTIISSSASRRLGSCIHAKFVLKPAVVRIEGFDYVRRGRRRGCSIAAVA